MRTLSILACCVLTLVVSCSSGDEKQGQKEEPTASERVGAEAASQIKATLQGAENARLLQEQHGEAVEKAIEAERSSGN